MATWQGALIQAEGTRLLEVAARHRIVVSEPSGPWLLIDVEPQLGRLGPPAFARALSKDLRTTVIAFFLQSTVSAERVEHWHDGELLRELEYYQDGGGWIAQRGTPQPWEVDYLFAEGEGTREGETWPSNLSDDVSDADIARFEAARAQRTPGSVMDLLSGGSTHRLCRSYGVDPQRANGYYRAPRNWRVWTATIAVTLFFVSSCVLGYVYR